ncbi:hypothetical protein LM900521_30068 [Listeria monocytogenes]|nr:hypothetical protein LM900521_30068 [Listeria monocytogenes]
MMNISIEIKERDTDHIDIFVAGGDRCLYSAKGKRSIRSISS